MIYAVYSLDSQSVRNWLATLEREVLEIDAALDDWLPRLILERNQNLFGESSQLLLIKNIQPKQIQDLKKHSWLKEKDIVFWFPEKLTVKDKSALQSVVRGEKIKEIPLSGDNPEALMQYARDINLKIKPLLLRQLSGLYQDNGSLFTELRKLKDYFQDDEVDASVFSSLLQRPLQSEDKLTGLLESLTEKNPVKTYQILRKERLLGTEPVKIMGFVNFFMLGRGNGFSHNERKSIFGKLASIDVRLKKGILERESFYDELFSAIYG